MKLETNLELSLLAEIYKNLLTEKQQSILKDFLDNNLSITELALEYNSSRQAINDLLKRTFKVLQDYENKLGLLNKYKIIKNYIAECEVILNNKDSLTQIKQQIKIQLNKILEVI